MRGIPDPGLDHHRPLHSHVPRPRRVPRGPECAQHPAGGRRLGVSLDFDRGRLKKPGLWCDGNLVRLRRSLEKITYKLPPEHFSEADWHGLLDGYRQSGGHPGASSPPAAGTASTPAATNGSPPAATNGSVASEMPGDSFAGPVASVKRGGHWQLACGNPVAARAKPPVSTPQVTAIFSPPPRLTSQSSGSAPAAEAVPLPSATASAQ